jgi:hypothetical protein
MSLRLDRFVGISVLTISLVLIVPCLAAPQSPRLGAKDLAVTATLLSAINTKTASQNDKFVARVSSPPALEGAVIEGVIKRVKRSKNNQRAEVLFEFQTLTLRRVTYPIRADLTGATNSKGIENVDEEGRAIARSSSKSRILATILGTAAGAAVGGAAGGGKGAAIGAGAGAAAGLLIGIKFTAHGPDIEFAPGSQFSLVLSDRNAQ